MAILHFRDKNAPLGLALTHLALAVVAETALVIRMAISGATGLLAAASVIFALAALGGLVMLALRLKSMPPPKPLIGVHGALAVIALVCLLVRVSHGGAY